MTPQEENKFLGIAHLVYGGYNAFIMLFVCFFMFTFTLAVAIAGASQGEAVPFVVMLLVTLFVSFVYLLFTIPAFIAGYGLLKRKSWAKTAAYVAAALAALNVPMGTGLCIFTFLFLTGEKGRAIYGKGAAQPAGELNSPPPPAYGWSSNPNFKRERERQYAPPAQPPEWRG